MHLTFICIYYHVMMKTKKRTIRSNTSFQLDNSYDFVGHQMPTESPSTRIRRATTALNDCISLVCICRRAQTNLSWSSCLKLRSLRAGSSLFKQASAVRCLIFHIIMIQRFGKDLSLRRKLHSNDRMLTINEDHWTIPSLVSHTDDFADEHNNELVKLICPWKYLREGCMFTSSFHLKI